MCSQRPTSKKRSEAIAVRARNRGSYAGRRPGGAIRAAWKRLDVRLVLAEDVAHRPTDLAHRARVLQRLADAGHEVVGAAGDLAQLLQAPVGQRLVAIGLERLQPLDLGAFGLGIDTEDVLDFDVLFDVLVDADHDVLAGAVALLVAPGRLLDLALDERDGVDRPAELVDLADELRGPRLDVLGERLDEVGARERVDGVGGAGLVADDLLG